MNTPCGTCHYACDCREHKFAVLRKAALDATDELEGVIETTSPDKQDDIDRMRQIICRVNAACAALGAEIVSHREEETPA